MTDRVTLTRRGVLQGLGAATALGCGASSDPEQAPVAPTPGAPQDPASPETSPPPAGPGPDKPSPKELLAGIEHIVVLMMENRSFDHFLGALKNDSGYAAKADVDGLTGTEWNPAPDETPVQVYKLDTFTAEDPPHSWTASHAQFNGGKNDGFVKAHAGATQNEVMGYYERSQLPFFYWLADNFAICDHWYASVMGPTWPNRYYLHAGTSNGKKDNKPFLVGAPETIWERLAEAKLSFKNYYAGLTSWYAGGFASKILQLNPTRPIDEFFEDAKKGTLPAFSIIDPDYLSNDDHPPHDVQRGQAFVASVYKALADSPLWPKTLFIITYDEHGGFFDHVPPPAAPDSIGEFAQYGFRVPSFVIGPTVRKGYVSKTVYDHTSVAATVRTRFGIRDLSKRMEQAADVTDCIDPLKVKAPAAAPTGMPQVAMTMQAALHEGVGVHSLPSLAELVDKGIITEVDPRTPQERVAAWLEHAVRLGVVRIVG